MTSSIAASTRPVLLFGHSDGARLEGPGFSGPFRIFLYCA
jgi:hypothetical protein